MEQINFYTKMVDSCDSTLTLKANSYKDSGEKILSSISFNNNEPIYLNVEHDGSSIGGECFGLSIDQAEELVQELTKAIEFLKR